MSSKLRRELVKQNRLLVRQEGLAEADLKQILKAMAATIADRYHYGGEDAALQIVEDHRPLIAAALEKRLHQTALIFGGRTLERLTDLAKSYYPGLAPGVGPVRGGVEDLVEFPRDGLNRFLEEKGAQEIFESTIRRWVSFHALDRAVTITRTLKEAVRKVLHDSFADGTGEAGTAKLIRESIGNRLSQTNAARIARTEMHTASTIGSDEAARSTGLELVKTWQSAEDARTRPSHSAADGQEVGIDEPFDVGGESLMVPGDPSGSAAEIVNCRCAVLHYPVIGGEVIR